MQEHTSSRSVLIVSARSLVRVAIQSILAAVDLERLDSAAEKATAAHCLRTNRPGLVILDTRAPLSAAAEAYLHWIVEHAHQPTVLAICSPYIPTFSRETVSLLATGRLRLLETEIDAAALVREVTECFGTTIISSNRFGSGRLTPRQREILWLVATGRSNAEIGRKLVIAPGTVKRHLNSTFELLEARSRIDAVNRARALGYI